MCIKQLFSERAARGVAMVESAICMASVIFLVFAALDLSKIGIVASTAQRIASKAASFNAVKEPADGHKSGEHPNEASLQIGTPDYNYLGDWRSHVRPGGPPFDDATLRALNLALTYASQLLGPNYKTVKSDSGAPPWWPNPRLQARQFLIIPEHYADTNHNGSLDVGEPDLKAPAEYRVCIAAELFMFQVVGMPTKTICRVSRVQRQYDVLEPTPTPTPPGGAGGGGGRGGGSGGGGGLGGGGFGP